MKTLQSIYLLLEEYMIIYKATNKTNGKIYIGKTGNLHQRKKGHLRDSKSPKTRFHSAVKHYGIDGFNWDILSECASEVSDTEERKFVGLYDSMNTEKGYNQTPGGGGGNTWDGNLHKEETSRKLSQSISNSKKHKESHRSPEYIKLMTKLNREKAKDLEICKKISKSLKGKPFTESHRNNLSIGSTGKILSEEHRKNIGEAVRVRMAVPENRKRISDSLKGRVSPMKGRKMSKESRQKMRDSHNKRHKMNRECPLYPEIRVENT